MIIREIYGNELNKGFLGCLSQLYKSLPFIDKAKEVYRQRCLGPRLVTYGAYEDRVHDEQQIVGTITLILLRSYGHNCGLVARIEDVAVCGDHQRQGLGKQLVNHAVEQARKAGAYKVELSCKNHLVEFYSKCGFMQTEATMRLDFPQDDSEKLDTETLAWIDKIQGA